MQTLNPRLAFRTSAVGLEWAYPFKHLDINWVVNWHEGSLGIKLALLPMTEVYGSGLRSLIVFSSLRVTTDIPVGVTLGDSFVSLPMCLKMLEDKETPSTSSPFGLWVAALTCTWET